MTIFKEIEKIAMLNEKKKRLIELINAKYGDMNNDSDWGMVIDWDTAELVTLSKADIASFRKNGNATEKYFIIHSTGYYSGTSYYGYLWFKTGVQGQYVKVFFES